MMSHRCSTGVFTAVLVAAAPVAFASPSGKDLPTLTRELAECKQDLVDARSSVATADELLGLAHSRKVVLFPVAGVLMPMEPKQVSDFFILQTVAGKLTKDQLRKELARFAAAAQATERLLNELGADARAERDRIDGRCARLAQDLKNAQGGPVGGGSFVLDPNGTKVANNNVRELKIDVAAGTATWNHCCDGGKWDTSYSFKVPDTLTAGQTAKLTIGLHFDRVTPSQPLQLGIKAFAPDFARQLLVDYPSPGSRDETYDVPISIGYTDSKELVVTIEFVSSTVTYHYRHR